MLNKGMAFSLEERKKLRLEGLLPPYVMTQNCQAERFMEQLRASCTDLDRYERLNALVARNEQLFYRVLIDHVEELLPVVYTPTVGEACRKFGHIYHIPQGLYISSRDRGRVGVLLDNWPHKDVKAIVLTDGERILGLGDLGTFGMGIPIGKLQLYTACGGVPPSSCLPITVDVGTNNQELLSDPLYTGLRQERDVSETYDELIDELVEEAKRKFGPGVLLQFEDFGNRNAARLLARHRDASCVFNDDIQGTAAVALAGVIASAPLTGKRLRDHTYLFFGAGSAATGVAKLLTYAIVLEEKCSEEEAKKRIYMFDSQGLVVKSRKGLTADKLPFAQACEPIASLAMAVKTLKPTCLFGLASVPGAFSEEVIRSMASSTKNPVIFAMSNPTSQSECTAQQAYSWTEGSALFAGGSPFAPVTFKNRTFVPGQANNAFIFPGMALGVLVSGARRVTERMFYMAAVALAKQVGSSSLAAGTLYPSTAQIRHVSAHVAAAVCKVAYEDELAAHLPEPDDLLKACQSAMYAPTYPELIDG